MAVESFPAFLQNETYSAAVTRRAIYYLLARGSTVGSVAGGVIGGTDLLITQNGTPNMSVNAAVGEAIIPGSSSSTQSGYYLYDSSTTSAAIATSDPSNPRIDLVAATVGDTAFGGTDGGSITVTKGTAAGSPVAPSLPTTSSALADIAVGAAVSSIVTANITDARTFAILGIGIWNTRRVSGASTINAVHGDHIVVTSGNTPIVAPAIAANARFKTSNQGSGVPTVTQHASEKFYGLGLGSSGSTTYSLGSVGANTENHGDGVAWNVAGNQDSGWTATGITMGTNMTNSSLQMRVIGNSLLVRGLVTYTGSPGAGTVAFTLPTGFRPAGGGAGIGMQGGSTMSKTALTSGGAYSLDAYAGGPSSFVAGLFPCPID